MRRREDGERCRPRPTSESTGRSEHVESPRGGDGGPADLKKTEGQGHEHLCDVTSACLYGTEILAMTERQQQRLQVCENNWVRKIARVAKADKSVEELGRETGEEQTIVGRTRRKDGG